MTSRAVSRISAGAAKKTANRRFAAVFWGCLTVALLCLALTAPPLWRGGYPKEDGAPFFSVGKDLIDVNSAPAAELACLPGIGEKKARAIIEYREQNGPFSAAEDLAQVDGISLRMAEAFLPMICFSADGDP